MLVLFAFLNKKENFLGIFTSLGNFSQLSLLCPFHSAPVRSCFQRLKFSRPATSEAQLSRALIFMEGIIPVTGNLQIDLSALTNYDIYFLSCKPNSSGNVDMVLANYNLIIASCHYEYLIANYHPHTYSIIIDPTRTNSCVITSIDNQWNLSLTFTATRATIKSTYVNLSGNASLICIP